MPVVGGRVRQYFRPVISTGAPVWIDCRAAIAIANVAIPSWLETGGSVSSTTQSTKDCSIVTKASPMRSGVVKDSVVVRARPVQPPDRRLLEASDLDCALVTDHLSAQIVAVAGGSAGGEGGHRASRKSRADDRVVHVAHRPHAVVDQSTALAIHRMISSFINHRPR